MTNYKEEVERIKEEYNINTRYAKIMLEQYFRFDKVPKNKRQRIIDILLYCKEIRNTAYPMSNSNVTQLELVEFIAHKEKDIFYINGSMSLVDGERSENRTFEAYILENEDKLTVYLDVTRLCVEDEPKMIRTSETFVETQDTVMSLTKYAGGACFEEKIFSEEFPIPAKFEQNGPQKVTTK